MEISNRDIRRIYMALAQLSGRVLPSISSDLKVAKLLREYFRVPYEVTEDLREKIVRDHPSPEDEGGTPPSVIEARNDAFAEVLVGLQEVRDVPESLFIERDDLPKELKSAPENRAGVADIVFGLGFLYRDDCD